MEVRNPSLSKALTVSGVEVFSGNSSVAWADLDLSGTIGAIRALVLVKVLSTVNTQGSFRTKGDTDEFYGPTAYGCASWAMYSASPYHAVCLVMTDAAGVIQWIANQVAATTIDIICWIK
ncbi:unnamed protein product [marine sediment metagenome]|uniref:Uncharacterized protein n=1 Tax=marine sediment metagenome TaxID=412755 RepID=X1FG30_9ZZZZ